MVCCARCNSESENNTLCEECERILQNRIDIVLEEEFPQTEGYDSKYFVDLPKHYECPLCLGGLRDPVQIAGECGHVFCGSCLNLATPGEPKTCPLDREPFMQTFPDRSKRREVLSLKVTCQNNGCSWIGELSDLLDHLRENCGRLLLSCLNLYCPEKLCREKIIEHCLECKFAPSIPCTFVQFGCIFEGSRSNVGNHMKTHVNEHLSLTIAKINQQDNKIEELNKRLEQQENMATNKFKELNERFDLILVMNKTNDKKPIALEIKNNNLQENNNDFKIQNAELIQNNDEYKKEHAELKLKYEELQEKCYYLQSVLLNKDNKFFLEISNYQTQFQNAQYKNPKEIYSPAFYTSHGYKFQLSAYLNGNGSGEHTHTGVFFHLCKGVNDDTLEWPFNKKYTLTIVSQNDRVVDKTWGYLPAGKGEDTKQCFEKPTANRNVGWGFLELLPNRNKQHYIKDDVMVIKCVVE